MTASVMREAEAFAQKVRRLVFNRQGTEAQVFFEEGFLYLRAREAAVKEKVESDPAFATFAAAVAAWRGAAKRAGRRLGRWVAL